MKYFGLPYMGSKSDIVKEIFDILTSAEYFVDLFGGGGSLSHYASLSGKYEKIIYNEIDTNIFNIFKNACLGKYKTFKWLSNEEFNKKLKNNDIDMEMVLMSFGSNVEKGYCFSRERESINKDGYDYVMNCDLNGLKNNELLKKYDYEINENEFLKLKDTDFFERKKFMRRYFLKQIKDKKYIFDDMDFKIFDSLIKFRLFSRFQRILNLSKIKNIEFYNLSYENVSIPEDSVVICDIPYKDTADYNFVFDYKKFYDWCRNNKNMIFINEYSMPDEFYLVKSFKKTRTLTYNLHLKLNYKEKLFCNRIYEEYGINHLF